MLGAGIVVLTGTLVLGVGAIVAITIGVATSSRRRASGPQQGRGAPWQAQQQNRLAYLPEPTPDLPGQAPWQTPWQDPGAPTGGHHGHHGGHHDHGGHHAPAPSWSPPADTGSSWSSSPSDSGGGHHHHG